MTDLRKYFADSLQTKYEKTHDGGDQSISDQTSGKKLNNIPDFQKSRGDGHRPAELNSTVFGTDNLEVASLCPVDRMRIDQLISELEKCRESRNKMRLKLAVSNSENEALQQMIESWYSERKSEKKNLESELSRQEKNFRKSTTGASRSLEILADRISNWQDETVFVIETLGDILKEKIHLQKEMNDAEVKVMLLTAEESRLSDAVRMDELYSKKQDMETDMKSVFETGCQNEEESFP